MTKKIILLGGVLFGLLLMVFVLAGVSNQSVQAAAVSSSASNIEQSKDILIHFHAKTSVQERLAYIQAIPGELHYWIEPLHVAKVSVPVDYVVADVIIGGTNADVLVEAIENDGLVYGTAQPNDPDLYNEQRVYTSELLGMFDAWDYTMGSPDVVVAVLDTGIAFEHPEFDGRILDGYDYYNNDSDPTDDHGHGTHVAGTVAAAVNNGVGAAGLCGQCSILPVKVLNQNNAGTWSGVASGIIFAADNDADIIVMSLGSTSGTQVVEDAINYAISNDVLVIAAAGNANSSRDFYPAAYEGVIGVAATNRDDERWVLSNYGEYVDLSAPGHVIYSTYYDLSNSYEGHVFMSGTSMATPHVGGLAGLIKSQDTSRTSAEIIDIMLNSALDLGEPGNDDYFGTGRIDPVAALAYDSPALDTATLGGLVWIDLNADGSMGGDESGRISGAAIKLYDNNDQFAASASSDANGKWEITGLAAGSYYIVAEGAGQELIWTNGGHANVTLSAGQNYANKFIGFVETLPDDVVSEINVYREGVDVNISWEVTSDLVTGLQLDRAINSGDYETVKTIDFSLAGTSRAIQSFADTLPEGMEDASVSYRMQVSPGETYLETIEADTSEPGTTTPPPATVQPPPATNTRVFLPWASSP